MSQNKQQNLSPSKRTSHFYKKRLSKKQAQTSQKIPLNKANSKIQKRPKQAKIRAKQARQRKKVYIETLERKISQLEKQIQGLRDKINLSSKDIKSVRSAFVNINRSQKIVDQSQEKRNDALFNNSNFKKSQEDLQVMGIKQLFNSLYISVKQKNQQETAKNVALLRDMYGVAGGQRIKWIQDLFSKIVEVIMPMHCRLFLQNCQKSEEFYKLLGGSESFKPFRKLFFDFKSKSSIVQSRPLMQEIKGQYERILQKIKQIEWKIINQAKTLQNEIDKIQNQMNPLFVGKILVQLDLERRGQNLCQIFPTNYYKRIEIKQEKYQGQGQVKRQNANNLNQKYSPLQQRNSQYYDDQLIFNELFGTI